MTDYCIPENTAELFANGDRSYHIKDRDQAGDNIFAMNLFLECVGVPSEIVECHDGTQVTLFDGRTRMVIDSGGLGDFHLHGYDVTILEANDQVEARRK
jgi:hypothetical protein